MDDSITATPLCAACSVIFSRISLDGHRGSERPDEFSYTTDALTLQGEDTCSWCTELAAAVNDYESPETLGHVPLTVSLNILKYWENDTISRHTLILQIRVEKRTFARRSYECFYCASF